MVDCTVCGKPIIDEAYVTANRRVYHLHHEGEDRHLVPGRSNQPQPGNRRKRVGRILERRRLREALATIANARGTGVLSPIVLTPEAFLELSTYPLVSINV